VIRVDKLNIHVGRFRLDEVSFEVPSGDYGVLMGKTGSGKTTVLEAVTGLKHVSSGRILLGSTDVTRLKPAERDIGFVPQDGALFSTMSVRDHLGFALAIRRVGKKAIRRRVAELAEMLEIGHLLDRGTAGLSGGEQQRVALGRALAFRPATLCLDEPLSALDDDTRHQTMELLKRVQKDTGVTALHITHNRSEADVLADVLLELVDGKVRRGEKREGDRERGRGGDGER
jgi:ABC-type sugar transport system ATPase subunit